MPLLEPVQGPKYTTGYKSPTELLRAIAQHSGWCVDENDQLVDGTGNLIASSIEDAAAAADQLRWYVSDPDGVETGVYWSEIPNEADARAAAIRAQLA